MPRIEQKWCANHRRTNLYLDSYCISCHSSEIPVFYAALAEDLTETGQSFAEKNQIIAQKDQELNQWKNKYTGLIQQRKTTIQSELNLLRNLLNSHE